MVQLYRIGTDGHNHGGLHLPAVEVKGVPRGDGLLHLGVEKGPRGQDEGQDPQIVPQLPGQGVHNGPVAPVADEEDKPSEAVACNALGDLI